MLDHNSSFPCFPAYLWIIISFKKKKHLSPPTSDIDDHVCTKRGVSSDSSPDRSKIPRIHSGKFSPKLLVEQRSNFREVFLSQWRDMTWHDITMSGINQKNSSHDSGQIIATPGEVTPNEVCVRESSPNPFNACSGIILICPDDCPNEMKYPPKLTTVACYQLSSLSFHLSVVKDGRNTWRIQTHHRCWFYQRFVVFLTLNRMEMIIIPL